MTKTDLIHVLLVEDNDDDAYLISEALEEQFHITRIQGGQQAYEHLTTTQTPPDVILLDYRLPEMNGVEIIQELNKQGKEFAYIVLTVDLRVETAIEAMKAGSLDFLPKSKGYEELPEMIRKVDRIHQAREEKKRMEVALRESEGRLRSLFTTMTEGVLLIAPDGQIIQANPAAERILGLTRSEIEARNYVAPEWEILDSDRMPMPPEEMAGPRAMKEKRLVKDQIQGVKHPDGSISWINVSVIPLINDNGEIQGIVGTFADITERKRAEEALQKAHDELEIRVEERTAELRLANVELAKALRLKDEFLATMSHELRTPLNVVLGMSESLQEEVYGPLNEKQRKSVGMIEESGRHLLTLLSDILDLAEIGAGKLQLDITPVDVDAVCGASLRLIKPLAQKKRLKISASFISCEVTSIQADERRLKQMLVNLLNNAAKFTPEGGTIGLEVEADLEKRTVDFIVWDTGIGIAEEDLDRLFQPFMQLDSSLSRKYEGTGLGLALVDSMVKLHGGSIAVESEVGKGSRFTITLPWEKR